MLSRRQGGVAPTLLVGALDSSEPFVVVRIHIRDVPMTRKGFDYPEPFLNVVWNIIQGKNKSNFLNLVQCFVSGIFSHK
jgi:hypothetical protein